MTEQREYLVALDVRSTLHAWIAAASEEAAIEAAEELGSEASETLTVKGGSVESAVVLDSRPASPPKPTRRFRIGIEQPPVHTIIVEAADLDAAIEKAEAMFQNEPGFYPKEPPAGWERHFNDWDIVEAEEVLP